MAEAENMDAHYVGFKARDEYIVQLKALKNVDDASRRQAELGSVRGCGSTRPVPLGNC